MLRTLLKVKRLTHPYSRQGGLCRSERSLTTVASQRITASAAAGVMIDACCHGSLTAASSYGRRVEMDGWRNSLVGGTAAMPVRAGKHMYANVTIWRQHLCVWSQIVWPWRRFCIAMVTWCLYYADSIVCLTIRRTMFTAFSAYRHFVCWYFTDKNLFNCFTYLCHIERIIWIYYTGRWYRIIKRFVDYHKENWLVRVGHVILHDWYMCNWEMYSEQNAPDICWKSYKLIEGF